MIRKKEDDLIEEFCLKNNLTRRTSFHSAKQAEDDMSRHIVTFEQNGKEILVLEKRTIYNFDEDNMGVIWAISDSDEEPSVIDSLYASLKYMERLI